MVFGGKREATMSIAGEKKRHHFGERLGLNLLQNHRRISHRSPGSEKGPKTLVNRYKLLS